VLPDKTTMNVELMSMNYFETEPEEYTMNDILYEKFVFQKNTTVADNQKNEDINSKIKHKLVYLQKFM